MKDSDTVIIDNYFDHSLFQCEEDPLLLGPPRLHRGLQGLPPQKVLSSLQLAGEQEIGFNGGVIHSEREVVLCAYV